MTTPLMMLMARPLSSFILFSSFSEVVPAVTATFLPLRSVILVMLEAARELNWMMLYCRVQMPAMLYFSL